VNLDCGFRLAALVTRDAWQRFIEGRRRSVGDREGGHDSRFAEKLIS
jgi:hypothetical protein